MSASANLLRNTAHILTEVDVEKVYKSRTEVCFLGRSNVGKSSLINALCSKKNMAHASSTPGKTRTINVYEVSRGHWLVDLPGYGFAVGGKKAKSELGGIIESYLHSRDSLGMVYVIVDAVAGPTKLDLVMNNWLKHYGFTFSIIVNKIDKIPVPKLSTRKEEILIALGDEDRPMFWVSTTKGLGIPELQHDVARSLLLIAQ